MLRTLVYWLRSRLFALGTTPGQRRPFIRGDRLPDWTSLLQGDPDFWQEALATTGNDAWIRNKGLTRDVDSQDGYFRMLGELPFGERMDEVTVQRARKYAYHFFFRRMIPLPFVESMAKAPNFRVELRGLRDLLPGACPGLDVICDGILDASRPFICPAEETGLHDANGPGTA